jgi:hypothetical protein
MKLPRRTGRYLPVLLTLAACNIATDGAPIWDMTWNVPGKSTTIAVSSFLPNGVTSVSNNTLFQASVAAPAPITRTLGQDCPDCVPANGQNTAKPAFTATFGSNPATLPSAVTSATLVTDTIVVAINNGYGFDPIRPPGGSVGSIQLTATSGTVTLGTVTFSGATQAMPSGTVTTLKVPISGVVSSAGIRVTAVITSPAGSASQPVLINTNQQTTVSPSVKGALSNTVLLNSAIGSVSSQNVTSTSNLDLSSIDKSVQKRASGGKLFLTVTNPYPVAGTIVLTLSDPSKNVSITKTGISLPAGSAPGTATALAPITFTQSEIQSMLGSNLTLTVTGPVSSTGAITVTPTSPAVAIGTRLELTLCTDSNNGCQ